MKKIRGDEKAENEATISEAKEAKDAVAEAIDTLEKFYKTAAKGSSEFIQGVEDDAPEVGFEGDYKGQQEASGGIIGMLEVIKSDFERTITETEQAEAQAEQDFLEGDR